MSKELVPGQAPGPFGLNDLDYSGSAPDSVPRALTAAAGGAAGRVPETREPGCPRGTRRSRRLPAHGHFAAVTVWMTTVSRRCHRGARSPAVMSSPVARPLVRALPRRLVSSVGHSHAENRSVRTR